MKSSDSHNGYRVQAGRGLWILSFTDEETRAQTANWYKRGSRPGLVSPNSGVFPEHLMASRAPCQGSAHFVCKVLDSKYYSPYRALGLWLSCSTLPL